MRPFATEGDVYPSPSPVAFQASFGPSAGQDFSRPVSRETPVRSGPRHGGQSAARTAEPASETRSQSAIHCNRFLIILSPVHSITPTLYHSTATEVSAGTRSN